MITRRPLLLALILAVLVVLIGLLQKAGLFAPVDQLAMKIVGKLRDFHGAGVVTALSDLLANIGEGGGRMMIACTLGFFLARAGKPRMIAWLLVTVAAMIPINALMKLVFVTPRPEMLEHLSAAVGHSFPSGHAAGAMTLYGALAMLARNRGITMICGAMILATGLSRVWLGVHWPSDVIGGWIEGVAWLLVMSHVMPRPRVRPARESSNPFVATPRRPDEG